MARTLGLGTVLKYDSDDSGSAFDTITLVVNATPPPRRRVRIPAPALADTLATDEMGMEEASYYTFQVFEEPNDTQSASFNTIFSNKTQLIWQIVYSSTDTQQFEGVVSDLETLQVTAEGLLLQQVTVHRKTASTWS